MSKNFNQPPPTHLNQTGASMNPQSTSSSANLNRNHIAHNNHPQHLTSHSHPHHSTSSQSHHPHPNHPNHHQNNPSMHHFAPNRGDRSQNIQPGQNRSHHPNINNNNNLHHHSQYGQRQIQPQPSHHPHSQSQLHPAQRSHQTPTGSNVETIDFKIFESIEYPFCTDLSKYEQISKIGQGTFGEVHKSICKVNNELVALKKVLTDNEKEGFPITALREIKILQVLKHENIVRLLEICTSKATAANKYRSQFYLVFEFCEHDLAGLLSNPSVKFSLGEQKKIMQQLLNGLYYIHKNCILHRDMKTANILVTKEGKLKLADFGLARALEQHKSEQAARYTNRVVTLWYRPPELLLGERCYGKAIDIWGAGCIMAELWTREPILKGSSEPNQLELIQSMCGSITSDVWPDVEKLELFHRMQLKPDYKRKIKERLGSYIKDTYALDLLDKLLTLDPKMRLDSDDALDHDFFWTDPMPCDLKLEKLGSSGMYEFTTQSFKRSQFNRQQQKPAVTEQQHYDRVY